MENNKSTSQVQQTAPAPGQVPEAVPPPQDATHKAIGLLKTYGYQAVVGVMIAAAVAVAAYRYFGLSLSGKEEAAAKLFAAKSTQDLEAILSQHASSPVAPLALLKLAKVNYNSGNYDMALSKYNEFKSRFPTHEFVDAAEMGSIHCMEARNQLQDALSAFTAFATTRTNHFMRAEAVLGQARCLEQLGRTKEAIAVYEDFIAANPESAWLSKVEDLLAALKKRTAEKKTSP